MKKKYQKPELETERFITEVIMAGSGDSEGSGDDWIDENDEGEEGPN